MAKKKSSKKRLTPKQRDAVRKASGVMSAQEKRSLGITAQQNKKRSH